MTTCCSSSSRTRSQGPSPASASRCSTIPTVDLRSSTRAWSFHSLHCRRDQHAQEGADTDRESPSGAGAKLAHMGRIKRDQRLPEDQGAGCKKESPGENV